jgi:hypothetical protein
MGEFLQGVYGPAAPRVREYIDLLCDKVESEKIAMTIVERHSAGIDTPEQYAAFVERYKNKLNRKDAKIAKESN